MFARDTRGEFQQQPGAHLVVDRIAGRILDATEAACALFGHPRAALTALTCRDLCTRSAEAADCVWDRPEPPELAEVTRCLAKIAPLSHRACAAVLPGGSGDQILITFLNGASAPLTADDQRFFDVAPEPMCVATLGGTLLRVNRALARLLEYDAAALLGHGLREFVHPDDLAAATAEVAAHQNSGAYTHDFDCRMVTRSGAVRLWSWHATWDQPGDRVYAVARDITTRRRLFDELTREQRRMNLAQRVARLGSWDWELGTETATWSEELFHVFAVSPLDGDQIALETFLQRVHPDDRAEVVQRMQRVEHSHEPFQMDYRIVLADGSEKTIHSRGEVFVDERDRRPRVIGTALDITERRRIELRHEVLIEELRAALARVKTLHGLLPICSGCKRIRTDQGYWEQIEVYLRAHSDAEFSHGLCPACIARLYPEIELDPPLE